MRQAREGEGPFDGGTAIQEAAARPVFRGNGPGGYAGGVSRPPVRERALMTTTEPRPIGFGRLTRKEDARFIRGQGRYVDDVQLPGMLHAAVLRSPLAPARIVSIDASGG